MELLPCLCIAHVKFLNFLRNMPFSKNVAATFDTRSTNVVKTPPPHRHGIAATFLSYTDLLHRTSSGHDIAKKTTTL